jgi:hypothetical protein
MKPQRQNENPQKKIAFFRLLKSTPQLFINNLNVDFQDAKLRENHARRGVRGEGSRVGGEQEQKSQRKMFFVYTPESRE